MASSVWIHFCPYWEFTMTYGLCMNGYDHPLTRSGCDNETCYYTMTWKFS